MPIGGSSPSSADISCPAVLGHPVVFQLPVYFLPRTSGMHRSELLVTVEGQPEPLRASLAGRALE